MLYQLELEQRAIRRRVATELADMVKEKNGETLYVAIGGVPCGGKTWFSKNLRDELNQVHKIRASVVQQDGYHYPRSELDKWENKEEAYARRGAPFTYDSQLMIDQLYDSKQYGMQSFPSFNHHTKDPE